MTAGIVLQVWADAERFGNGWSLALAVKFQISSHKMAARLTYALRLAFWTARHRSIETARWVVAYEGYSW